MKPAAAPLNNRAGLFRQTEPPLRKVFSADYWNDLTAKAQGELLPGGRNREDVKRLETYAEPFPFESPTFAGV